MNENHGQQFIESKTLGNVAVLRLIGDHNYHSNSQLQKQLDLFVHSNYSHFVIDLSDAKSINSLAIGTILGFNHQVKKYQGNLCLVHPPYQLKHILKLTRTIEYLNIFDKMDEAISYLSH